MIYKILLPSEWAAFEAAGRFDGSEFDRRSGFVHCSSREQVGAVAVHLFADEPALVVVALDDQALGDAVRWEPVAEGGVFPHVYASVPLDAVVSVHHVAGASSVDDALAADRDAAADGDAAAALKIRVGFGDCSAGFRSDSQRQRPGTSAPPSGTAPSDPAR